MNLAGFSVKRPVTITIAVLAVLLFGAISLVRLGLDLLPDLDFPVAVVVTAYPNADPETVENTVTKLVEGAVRTVPDVRNVTSVSRENISVVITEFNWGTDLDTATGEVSARLDALSFQLPEDAGRPMVLRFDPTQLPVAILGVGGEGGLAAVTRKVEETVKPALEAVDGVASVSISGAATPVIDIVYDSKRLSEYGLTPGVIHQLIGFQNTSLPAGPLTDGGVRYICRVGTELSSAEDIGRLVVGVRPPMITTPIGKGAAGVPPLPTILGMMVPQFIRVRDVAEVRETYREPEGYTRINGRPGLIVNVMKAADENTVLVANRVRAALEAVKKDVPELDIGYVMDQSKFIESSLSNLAVSGLFGGLLAMAVIFAFLRNYRPTLIIGVAIPLSVMVTFVLMYFGHLTLNLMTLGGLALGIGMLVDNSIVVLENIYRRRQLGEGAEAAAEAGTGEVGMAITASTATTLAVFLPVAFISGMAAQLFEELALTVAFSLLASLLVAMTAVPMLASRFVRLVPSGRAQISSRLPHERALEWCLDHKPVVFAATGAVVAAAAAAIPWLGLEFLPPIDTGELTVDISYPAGTPVGTVDRLARQVEDLLLDMPEVRMVSAQVGASGDEDLMAVFASMPPHKAKLHLQLVDRTRRRRSAGQIAAAVRAKAGRLLAAHPEAEIAVSSAGAMGQAGPLAGMTSETMTVEIKGPSYDVLQKLAGRLVDGLKRAPGVAEVASSLEDTQPVLFMDVSPSRAVLSGLTAGQVGFSVRAAVSGLKVTEIRRDGVSIPVIVRPREQEISGLEALKNMNIGSGLGLMPFAGGSGSLADVMVAGGFAGAGPGAQGAKGIFGAKAEGAGGAEAQNAAGTFRGVTLGGISEPRVVPGPLSILRENGQRVVTVTASLSGIDLRTAERLARRVISGIDVPEGYSVALGGVHRLMADSFADLELALALAVVLVYMVMAVQFESLLYPLIVMFTVPLAAIGAILGLLATKVNLGITGLIGMVMLAGIVVNNGIVLVDCMNRLRQQGLTAREAALSAGKVRLRPVLMTSLTTILGLLPLALGFGDAAELEVPLAVTVIGGLLTSTLLTLFVVPALYEVFTGPAETIRDPEGRR